MCLPGIKNKLYLCAVGWNTNSGWQEHRRELSLQHSGGREDGVRGGQHSPVLTPGPWLSIALFYNMQSEHLAAHFQCRAVGTACSTAQHTRLLWLQSHEQYGEVWCIAWCPQLATTHACDKTAAGELVVVATPIKASCGFPDAKTRRNLPCHVELKSTYNCSKLEGWLPELFQ